MSGAVHYLRPANEQDARRAERRLNAAYQHGYWQGYMHALRETTLLDAGVIVVTFLMGVGFSLAIVG
jgi:hypothetical protein